jgi:hypothetical protein
MEMLCFCKPLQTQVTLHPVYKTVSWLGIKVSTLGAWVLVVVLSFSSAWILLVCVFFNLEIQNITKDVWIKVFSLLLLKARPSQYILVFFLLTKRSPSDIF